MGNFSRSNGARRWQAKACTTVPILVDDVVATITSGGQAGSVGPFDLSASDGRQTLANIVGVSAHRNSAADGTGITERITPNQDNNLISIYNFVPAADANNGFIRNGAGTRISLAAESGTTTQNYMATRGFLFVTEVPA